MALSLIAICITTVPSRHLICINIKLNTIFLVVYRFMAMGAMA